MRTLKLDFLHPQPRTHWSAWLLLVVGLAVAAWAGWRDRDTRLALDHALADAPKQEYAKARRSVTVQAGESGTAMDQLSAPWRNLFVRLEESRPKRIALLALEADVRKNEATLTAEARNSKDMLAYIEMLKKEAGFSSVTLASHALQYEDTQHPLRFVLRLGWRG